MIHHVKWCKYDNMGQISIKTEEDIQGMRIAGRLAAEVLDFIAPHVKQGITTDELSALAKSYLGRDRVSRATVLPGK